MNSKEGGVVGLRKEEELYHKNYKFSIKYHKCCARGSIIIIIRSSGSGRIEGCELGHGRKKTTFWNSFIQSFK